MRLRSKCVRAPRKLPNFRALRHGEVRSQKAGAYDKLCLKSANPQHQTPPAPYSPSSRRALTHELSTAGGAPLELVAIIVIRRRLANSSPLRSQHIAVASRVGRIEHHPL